MQGKGNQDESVAGLRIFFLQKTTLRLILIFKFLSLVVIYKTNSLAPILIPSTSLISSQHDLIARVLVD
jgi:hypothetical protein